MNITDAQPLNLNIDAVVSELNKLVDQFTCRGSDFVLYTVTKLHR